jgi:O-acetyl-ADP-ribose deacetylase (regulator of RNase III)
LRAAYLGTLLATAGLGHGRVVLTLIGGGVFGNPHEEIWSAILWSLAELPKSWSGPLDVLVSAREGAPELAREAARSSGGASLRFGSA